MNLYESLKLIHVACVVISGALFALRFALLNVRPKNRLPKQLKVLPHVVDTVLLVAAIGMLLLSAVNPFQVTWLTAKIIALVAYILFGAFCLRSRPGSARQAVMFVVAASVFVYMVWVAVSKHALPAIV
ncbi:MAG: SirB2 family protein [Woeseia sp.]|jgi:uncharacterized membrane protein SirB2|nr:SirB2 family protein [Woeseia sp.]